MTDYAGIDYGLGMANVDKDNGIRYGVIPQNDVLQAWADSSEPNYGQNEESYPCPECGHDDGIVPALGDTLECEECGEVWECEYPEEVDSWYVDDGEYLAESDSYGDIFILRSPYYTYAQFCSPCAPGACHLRNPLENPGNHPKTYCFAPDWFDDDIEPCPYPVWRVDTDELVYSPKQKAEL